MPSDVSDESACEKRACLTWALDVCSAEAPSSVQALVDASLAEQLREGHGRCCGSGGARVEVAEQFYVAHLEASDCTLGSAFAHLLRLRSVHALVFS